MFDPIAEQSSQSEDNLNPDEEELLEIVHFIKPFY